MSAFRQQVVCNRRVARLALVPITRSYGVAVRILERAGSAGVGALDIGTKPREDCDKLRRRYPERLILRHSVRQILEWLKVRHRREEIQALCEAFEIEAVGAGGGE